MGSFHCGIITTKEESMSYVNITEKDKQAIEKKELQEYEQRRLRGTGYDMMKYRDIGIGWLHNDKVQGKPVEIRWHVEDEKRIPVGSFLSSDGQTIHIYSSNIPEDKFVLKIGNEEALIDKQAFQKLFRWV